MPPEKAHFFRHTVFAMLYGPYTLQCPVSGLSIQHQISSLTALCGDIKMELETLLGESFLTIFFDIFWGGEEEVPGESTLTKVLPVWNTFDWNSSTQFSFICAAITKFKSRADVSKVYWTLNIWFSFLLLITLSNQNECRNSHIQKPQKSILNSENTDIYTEILFFGPWTFGFDICCSQKIVQSGGPKAAENWKLSEFDNLDMQRNINMAKLCRS